MELEISDELLAQKNDKVSDKGGGCAVCMSDDAWLCVWGGGRGVPGTCWHRGMTRHEDDA
jgi:hypothetical protein